MLNVVMLSDVFFIFMRSVVVLNAAALSVIILNDVMLTVVFLLLC